MKIKGDQNQQISFVIAGVKIYQLLFIMLHSVFKCLGHFVFNLGRLAVVRSFLGFAFQFFLIFFFFFYFHAPLDLEELNVRFSLVLLTHSLLKTSNSGVLFF